MRKKYEIYYKIIKDKNNFLVMKCRQCECTVKMYEVYKSKNIKDCIYFCKESNFKTKGFII